MEEIKDAPLNIKVFVLEEENAELKSELSKFSEAYKRYRDYEKEELAESCYDLARENEKLKADYIKLSKIVETTGGYKASYVNELRDKIAKLEFDIEAWKKLKAVQEEYIDEDLYDLDC